MQFDHDPEAFGVNTVPNPPSDSEKELGYSEADDSASEASCESMRPTSLRRRPSTGQNKMRRRLRKVAVASAIVAGMVTLGRRK